MNEKTKATLLAFLRAGVAMIIFVIAVINYEKSIVFMRCPLHGVNRFWTESLSVGFS